MPIHNAVILIVNIVSIFFLLGLSTLFYISKQHKNGLYTGITIITFSIPIYIYNILFICGWYKIALWIVPLAYSSGTVFLPSLWLYIHQRFNPGSRFLKLRFIHFLPTLTCFTIYTIYLLLLSFPERINFILYNNTYMSAWINIINITIIVVQIIIYSSIIHIYLSQVKKYISKNFSEIKWFQSMWIPKIIFFTLIAFLTSITCYYLCEDSSTWTPNIFTILIMYYFTYHAMRVPQDEYTSISNNPLADIQFDNMICENSSLSSSQIEKTSKLVTDYLKSSKSYLNPTLTISNIADSIGVSGKDISCAIEKTYNCTFFDYINKLRIERAVKALSMDLENKQNIVTITYQSGFYSKESFYTAFKKNVGKTPSQFIKEIGRETSL